MNYATLYTGKVMHKRFFPSQYQFSYRVFSLLLDIDHLYHLGQKLKFFSHNRFNLLSFYDKDHGPRDGTSLRTWITEKLNTFGIDINNGSVKLLSFPRVLGYTFNPLSLWYCYDASGNLIAVLCEVSNTFGESHNYLLHQNGKVLTSPVRQQHKKHFHVSPLISMNADYHFRLSAPDEKLQLLINEYQDNQLMLVAAQTGNASEFTDRTALKILFIIPLMTFKVLAAIHWQALKIWLRGGKYYRKPEPPLKDVTG